jgi:DNA primase
MTQTLPGADIRGFYARLNIALPRWSQRNAPARCFANPHAHAHADRSPSTSISLADGSWFCHGCGAKGGAFDAATSVGHTDRGAMELLIAHRLALRREIDELPDRPERLDRSNQPALLKHKPQARLDLSNAQLQCWHERLLGNPTLLVRLHSDRGWTRSTIADLRLGYDGQHITIPVRDEHGTLVSLLCYRPGGPAKIRAASGSRRALFPHPGREASSSIVLVEGEPDAIAARSRGLAAIALPGTESWQSAWARGFSGRDVTIIMDCDPQGRRCAQRVADDLNPMARTVTAVDLAPTRTDGYDLTDWLISHPGDPDVQLRALGAGR